MADYNFIRYKRTLADALSQDESVEVEQTYLGAIQLKPNDFQTYTQLSKLDFNLTLDNYKVFIVNLSKKGDAVDGCIEVEVTDNVTIVPFVEDGITQGKFIYSDIPHDFGNDLVYFKVQPRGAEKSFFYSNLLKITDNNIDKTVRLDYLDNTRVGFETLPQSIRLNFYKHNHIANTEIDSYYQISTEQNINSRIQENSLTEWYIPPINAWTFKRIEKAFYNGGFWIDLVRNYLTAPIEYTERQDLSNVSEQIFTTDPNEDDTLNIIQKRVQDPKIEMLSSTDVLSSTDQLTSEIVTY